MRLCLSPLTITTQQTGISLSANFGSFSVLWPLSHDACLRLASILGMMGEYKKELVQVQGVELSEEALRRILQPDVWGVLVDHGISHSYKKGLSLQQKFLSNLLVLFATVDSFHDFSKRHSFWKRLRKELQLPKSLKPSVLQQIVSHYCTGRKAYHRSYQQIYGRLPPKGASAPSRILQTIDSIINQEAFGHVYQGPEDQLDEAWETKITTCRQAWKEIKQYFREIALHRPAGASQGSESQSVGLASSQFMPGMSNNDESIPNHNKISIPDCSNGGVANRGLSDTTHRKDYGSEHGLARPVSANNQNHGTPYQSVKSDHHSGKSPTSRMQTPLAESSDEENQNITRIQTITDNSEPSKKRQVSPTFLPVNSKKARRDPRGDNVQLDEPNAALFRSPEIAKNTCKHDTAAEQALLDQARVTEAGFDHRSGSASGRAETAPNNSDLQEPDHISMVDSTSLDTCEYDVDTGKPLERGLTELLSNYQTKIDAASFSVRCDERSMQLQFQAQRIGNIEAELQAMRTKEHGSTRMISKSGGRNSGVRSSMSSRHPALDEGQLQTLQSQEVKGFLKGLADIITSLRLVTRTKLREQDETDQGWIVMERLGEVIWALDSAIKKAQRGAAALG